MTDRKNRIKEFEQYILNQNVDDSVNPGALVLGIKAKNDSSGYSAITSTVVGSDQALDVNVVQATSEISVVDTPEFFEDTNFVTGDSPVTIDCNAALGRNATQGYIINDGAGNFTIAFSTDGAVFGDAITMKKNEVLKFSGISVDSLKITWLADSAYRISCI